MIPADLEQRSPEEILAWTYRVHGRVALVSSFQAESTVLIDMACRITERPEVLTLDTGRLHEATHRLIDEYRERYPIRLRVLVPEAADVEAMTDAHGTMLFRDSVELRHTCCEVRKVRPLARALRDYDAWVTGVRREQAPSRAATQVAAPDAAHHGITKVAPLATWSRAQVWDYVERYELPKHALYARGFTSIGCEPCTRAVQPGDPERAGRWWWELGEVKECGLHQSAVMEVA